MSDFDVANVEFELERLRNNNQLEPIANGCGCFSLKFFILLFVGLVIFYLFGELMK